MAISQAQYDAVANTRLQILAVSQKALDIQAELLHLMERIDPNAECDLCQAQNADLTWQMVLQNWSVDYNAKRQELIDLASAVTQAPSP